LSVLRVLDVPQTLGLLPPRRLTLVNPPASLVETTGAIYRTAGWSDRMVVKPPEKKPAR
jgi:hypothetical protein